MAVAWAFTLTRPQSSLYERIGGIKVLLPTNEYDVLLISERKAEYTYEPRNKKWKIQVIGENADGYMYTITYFSNNKKSIDWMHPSSIKKYRKTKGQS